jgi:endonuclease/exonuclease/phosphatase family metal-dependent hydrolase
MGGTTGGHRSSIGNWLEQALMMRLLSYNIHKGVGGRDRRYRLDRIIEVIASQTPDLICLQEVDYNVRRSRFDDQPSLLARHLKAQHSLFQLNVPRQDGGYGNLILSRWPIHESRHICLRLRQRKPRGAQMAVVDTPEGHLHLINWHLGLSEKERHWQAQFLLEHEHFQTSAHLPTVITGDFNDWRNTLGKNSFGHHRFEQATAPIHQFRSFPAFFALASLDKIFYRGGLLVRHSQIIRTPLARRASDHLPLVLDFHLTPADQVTS